MYDLFAFTSEIFKRFGILFKSFYLKNIDLNKIRISQD